MLMGGRPVQDRFGPAVATAVAAAGVAASPLLPGGVVGLAAGALIEIGGKVLETAARRADAKQGRQRALEDLGSVIHETRAEVRRMRRLAQDLGPDALGAAPNQPVAMFPGQARMLRASRRKLGQLVDRADRVALEVSRQLTEDDIGRLGPMVSKVQSAVDELNCYEDERPTVDVAIAKIEQVVDVIDGTIQAALQA